jgi:hypothetical protein
MLAIAAGIALSGCATPTAERPAAPAQEAKAPAAAALGDFAPALRCMDALLLDHGVRDMPVLVEDLSEQTQRARSGARELIVAAVSDMTQRSRAIRVVAPAATGAQSPRAAAQYALRGSITQLESTVSVDLKLLTMNDQSVVPGTATRNSVVLSRDGRGFGDRAEIRKFGVTYPLAIGRTEGLANATRAVVDVAAVELFGRVTRVPYWTCFGQTDANAAVAAEIQDWYDAMAARPAEIIRYFQSQLRLRRAYEGPLDGAVNESLKEAVAVYREALGLSREPKLSLDFFRAYLGADHAQLAPRVAAARQPAPAPAAAASPVAPPPAQVVPPLAAAPAVVPTVAAPPAGTADRTPLTLRIAAANDARRFAKGEAVRLTIRPSRDAHVYCFLQDETRKIVRFFPNRYQTNSRVTRAGLELPGTNKFELMMNRNGTPETVSCFATERDVLAQLPGGINADDLRPLAATSLDQVRNAFAQVAGSTLVHEQFKLLAK